MLPWLRYEEFNEVYSAKLYLILFLLSTAMPLNGLVLLLDPQLCPEGSYELRYVCPYF